MNDLNRIVDNYLSSRFISDNVANIHTLVSLLIPDDEQLNVNLLEYKEIKYDMNKLIELLCMLQEHNKSIT